MGINLKLSVTSDKSEIFKVLGHPEIWPLLSKRAPEKKLLPLRDQDIYLIVKAGRKVIACTYFEVLNGYEMQMHPYVLPRYRPRYSYKAVKACVDWAFNQSIEKIVVEIPDDYPKVTAFAERMGFENVGNNTLEMRANKWAA